MEQWKLARALHISERALQTYEQGKRTIPTPILAAMSDYFGMTMDYIALGVERVPANKIMAELTAMEVHMAQIKQMLAGE